ncbi:MAG: RagB/SusD family nutrient uptake outer membrane protein [Saprospiraceae bacterium]|nr:RagB/SusD family nutrient uptake outer membrane protein [Saprospiraceae bacterium]
MKKLLIYFVAIMGLTITSCDEAIDITQPGRFSAENAFQSVDDLRLGLLSSYDELDITDMITFNSTFTDEISIGFDNGGQGLSDGRYGYILNSTSAAPGAVWVDQYQAINSATRVIEAANLITPEMGEEALYNDIIGQAYAIRAFAHFQLFSYFTTDYTDDNALCVIAVDFIPSVDQELGRNTVGEVVGLINSDLSEAESLLTDDTSNPTFINKDFVTALRARLAAYRQDYTTAATLAASLTAKYPLADKTQYFNMYEDTDVTEVIFKLERSIGDNYDGQATGGGGWAGALYAFVNSTLSGSPYFEMGRALYNSFDANDVRLDRNVDPSSRIDPGYATNPNAKDEDVLVIRKYPGSDGQPLLNDLKVFRSSEMLLIQAEAAAAASDFATVSSLIQQLREARIGGGQAAPNVSSSPQAFGLILDERRLEFCFEGHRYLDLKRMGIRANRGIDRDAVDCAINGSCTPPPPDDFRFTLPIPIVELNANSVIRDQQNPGY